MSEKNNSSAKTPYRAKIETGGKKYTITNGPGEKKFLLGSAVFQDGYPIVNFTVSTLGEIPCTVTGFSKTMEPIPVDEYTFFGKTGYTDILIMGYYRTRNRTGEMRFYTRKEVCEVDPVFFSIILGG